MHYVTGRNTPGQAPQSSTWATESETEAKMSLIEDIAHGRELMYELLLDAQAIDNPEEAEQSARDQERINRIIDEYTEVIDYVANIEIGHSWSTVLPTSVLPSDPGMVYWIERVDSIPVDLDDHRYNENCAKCGVGGCQGTD